MLNNDVYTFCRNSEPITKVLELFKSNFIDDYNECKSKEKIEVAKSLPYVFRHWYYSELLPNYGITPCNLIEEMVKRNHEYSYMVVPTITPIYKYKVIKDIQFDFKIFTLENHPIIQDFKLFLSHFNPDIEIDESGLLTEENRNLLKEDLTFKEIYYTTFLTNLSYRFKFIDKMPSINTFRAVPNQANIDSFFSKDNKEILELILDFIFENASSILSQIFSMNKLEFSSKNLQTIFSKNNNLDNVLERIFDKHKMKVINEVELIQSAFEKLENMDDLQSLEDFEKLGLISQEDLFNFAIKNELNFAFDICILTPLGYYLQFIQPMYLDYFSFTYFNVNLLSMVSQGAPAIKQYFKSPNLFDITVLGEEFLLKEEKNSPPIQDLSEIDNFSELVEDITNFNIVSFSQNNFIDFIENDFVDFEKNDKDKCKDKDKGKGKDKDKDKCKDKDKKTSNYNINYKSMKDKNTNTANSINDSCNIINSNVANNVLNSNDSDLIYLPQTNKSNKKSTDVSKVIDFNFKSKKKK